MKKYLLAVLVAASVTACGTINSSVKASQAQAQGASLVPAVKSLFDASFVAPNLHLSSYKKIKINDLDLSNVKIIKPRSEHLSDAPWELNNDDKKYYQEKFLAAAKENLTANKLFVDAADVGADTLELKTKIVEIAPLASKDDSKGRPNYMDVYTRGFGRMNIVFELYDSKTNQLVMLVNDDHDLGDQWEKNDRVRTNVQIRLAFDHWFAHLQNEVKAHQ